MTSPTNFDEIYTNSEAKHALATEFDAKSSKSRIFLSGPYGCGKRTMVRLFLKSRNYTPLIVDINDYIFKEEELADLVSKLEDNPCSVSGKWMCLVLTGWECGFAFEQKMYETVTEKVIKALTKMPVIIICDTPTHNSEFLDVYKFNLKVEELMTDVSMRLMKTQETKVFVKNLLKQLNKSTKPIIYHSGDIDNMVAQCDGTFADCVTKVKRHLKNMFKRNKVIERAVAKVHDEQHQEDDDDYSKKYTHPWTKMCVDYYSNQAHYSAEQRDNLDNLYDAAEALSLDNSLCKEESEDEDDNTTGFLLKKMHGASAVSMRHSKWGLHRDIYLGYMKSDGLANALAKSVCIKDGALFKFKKTLELYGVTTMGEYTLVNVDLGKAFRQYERHQEAVKKAEEYRQSKMIDDGYKRELYTERHIEKSAKEKNPAVVKNAPAAKKRKIDTKQATLDSIFFNKNKHKII